MSYYFIDSKRKMNLIENDRIVRDLNKHRFSLHEDKVIDTYLNMKLKVLAYDYEVRKCILSIVY